MLNHVPNSGHDVYQEIRQTSVSSCRPRSNPIPINRRGSLNKRSTNDRPGPNKVSRRQSVPRVISAAMASIPTVNIASGCGEWPAEAGCGSCADAAWMIWRHQLPARRSCRVVALSSSVMSDRHRQCARAAMLRDPPCLRQLSTLEELRTNLLRSQTLAGFVHMLTG